MNTLFPLASISKHITASALLKELDKKNISLDSSISKYIQSDKFSTHLNLKSISFKNLLSHRLGYKERQGDFLIFHNRFSSREIIEKAWSMKPIYHRTKTYGYHNAGYIVAGEILKKISDESYHMNLKENLFSPLEMNNTYTHYNTFQSVTNKATHYIKQDDTIKETKHYNLEKLVASGGIYSSINDMSKWIRMFLNNGKQDGLSILDPKLITSMKTPLANTRPGNHPFNVVSGIKYGLGLQIQEYENNEIVFHSGSLPGIITNLFLIPEKKIGVLILCNKGYSSFPRILKREILDAYLNLPYRNYNDYYKNKTIHTLKKKKQRYIPFSTEQMNDLEGIYFNELIGELTIGKKKNDLIANFKNYNYSNSKIILKEGNSIEIKCILDSRAVFVDEINLLKKSDRFKISITFGKSDRNKYIFTKKSSN